MSEQKNRGGVVEVIPGLYQRGNFLKWTYQQKQDLLREHGISVVVNLWNKVDPDLSGQCLYINWPIRGNAYPDQATAMIELVAARLVSGEHVLVHCEAGVNRSAWFCAELVAHATGWPYEQALAHVKTRIPRAKPHAAFVSQRPR